MKTSTHRECPRERNNERGAGALMVVFILSTLFMMIATGLILVQVTHTGLNTQLRFHGQAVNAAQAGLIDALAWFRRQTTQPVTTFAPAVDTSASPPVNETDDPSIGIVRDYIVDEQGSVWGRYEVRLTDVRDVTAARGKTGNGIIWSIEARGYIYVRKDGSKAFDEAPNQVLSRATATTEIQRLAIVLPANAGINCVRGDYVRTDSKTRLYGGDDIGIAYPPSTGTPTTYGELTGNPSRSQVDPYNDEMDEVFGVSQNELIAMADMVVTSVNDLPTRIPDMTLVVVNGNATFDSTHRMTGSGILVVLGNLTVSKNSYSSYSGLIYTTGNYVQYEPSQVNGALVSKGRAQLKGSSDFSEFFYDDLILAQVQRHMGQYRFNRNQQFD